MPIPIVQDQPSNQNYDELANKLPVTLGEAVGTTFKDELFNNAATAKIIDYNRKKNLESQDGVELSVEELDKRYEGLGLSWDGPKKEQVAEFIANKQREKLYNQSKIEAGPDGYLAGGLKLGAAVVAHAADPTELGLTIATAGVFRIGAAAAFGARAVQGAGLGARLAMGVGEGAVTQLALEPGEYVFDKEFQRDYDYTEAFKRVTYGALMGAGMEGLVWSGQKLMSKMKKTKAHAVAADTALTQMHNGEPVNVDGVISAFNNERMPTGAPEGVVDFSGRTQYNYEPFNSKAPAGKKVYLGTQSGLENLQQVSKEWRGAEGFTDHPLIANADAAGNFNEVNGLVHEAILSPEARIISTTDAIGQNERGLVYKALETAGLENTEMGKAMRALTKEIDDGNISFNSIDELLNGAKSLNGIDKEAVLNALEAPLSEMGFHGFHYPDGDTSINRFQFFDKALENNGSEGARLFEKSSPLSPDERLIQSPTTKDAADFMEASKAQAMEREREYVEFSQKAEAKGSFAPGEFEKSLDESMAEISQRISSLKEDPELASVVEYVNELDTQFKKVEKDTDFITKAAMKCVGLNG